MIARLLVILFFYSASVGICQTETKGIIIDVHGDNEHIVKNSYALIVGISTYKNPDIPSLKYADRDALAFKEFLLENGVEQENIHLLLNEQATNSAFWTLLNYISEKAEKGDRCYIYFSGHGDVETKTIVKDAYLLPYDSPSSVYPIGAIGVMYLKSWLATFSANGIQTVFVADACRSGSLIGGREGMEAAANILKDTWKDEIKIVSCQPGELSLESSEWGNGRGLFSFELINGLSGRADKNHDDSISLRELYLYMMEVVPEKAGAYPQNPIISGNLEQIISTKNHVLFSKNQNISISDNEISQVASTDDNYSEGEILVSAEESINSGNKLVEKKEIADVERNQAFLAFRSSEMKDLIDTNDLIIYEKFLEQIDNNVIVGYEPPNAYASYLDLLKSSSGSNELKQKAKLILSNKIMMDIKVLIEWMLSGSTKQNKGFNLGKVSVEATILRNIFGDKKLRENGNIAKVLVAESCRNLAFNRNDDLYIPIEVAMAKLDTALMHDPSAIYASCVKGFMFEKMNDQKRAIEEFKKALRANPNFSIARQLLIPLLIENKSYDSVITYLQMGKQSFYSDIFHWISYKNMNVEDSSSVYYARILNYCSTSPDLETIYQKNHEVAKRLLEVKESDEAVKFFEKTLLLFHRFMGDRLGDLLSNDRLNQSKKEIELLEEYSHMNYDMACAYALVGDKKKAMNHIEISLNAGWYDFLWMRNDTDLVSLHSKKFFRLIKKKEKEYQKKNS